MTNKNEKAGQAEFILLPDIHGKNGQNVTIWRVTRQKWHISPQFFLEKAKDRQYLTKNVHVW